MSSGHEIGGKYKEDPINSNKSRGKNRERRKHRNDGPSLTPTEKTIKDRLMAKYTRNGGEGGGSGVSKAFRDGYDLTFKCSHELPKPIQCLECEYVAANEREVQFHIQQVDHEFGTYEKKRPFDVNEPARIL